jgi:serine phosphatase RsbU (regulator of sigma subunit)/anti-sigma regulatory factor (Ser/Thr protein kinase)
MFRKPVREINAEFRAAESSLPAIRTLIRETFINAGFARKEVHKVNLAIEEGVTNIIRHAYLYEEGMIRFRIVVYKKRIIISLIDTGRSFQPEGGSRLDLEKLVDSGRKGGLGFYMIKKIMDSVEYLSAPGLNELRMTKLVSRQPERARLFMGRMFTLRVKFSVYTFLIMLVIIAGSYIFIDSRTTKNIHQHLHDTVAALSKTIADQAGGYILNRRAEVEFDDLARSYLRANPELKRLVLVDSTGSILADTRDIRNLLKKYEPPKDIDPNLLGVPQTYHTEDENLHYLIQPIVDRGKKYGEVHITYSSRQLSESIDKARRKVALLTIIGLAFGIAGIYWLSNYFVNPIVRITERVRKFSSGDIETELPLEGMEEYFEISKALNEMMTRLRRDHENIIEREKVAKEIEVAGQIQKTLLPEQLPEVPGLKLDAYYRAASRISGDLYDVFKIDDSNYCLLVADVSGKGIPASLIMSVLRTVIRIMAVGKTRAHTILNAVNDYIKNDIPAGIFITIFLGVYNIETKKLNFVSAGHNPLIYCGTKEKNIKVINPPGIPLGLPLQGDISFADKLRPLTIDINIDDTLFIYSDGITEAMDRTGNKYGLEKLTNIFERRVMNNSRLTPEEISHLILEDIDRHCGLAAQADDITFITVCSVPDTASEEEPGIETQNLV